METTTETKSTPLAIGDKVVVVKGCQARSILKGRMAKVTNIIPPGAKEAHQVKVLLYFPIENYTVAWYARHPNRLADPVVNLNDGNPLHKIQVRKARS